MQSSENSSAFSVLPFTSQNPFPDLFGGGAWGSGDGLSQSVFRVSFFREVFQVCFAPYG